MTKTQYYTASALDGFIADESNSLEWLFEVDRGSDPGDEFSAFWAGVGAMAMGATTYEWVMEHESANWQKYYADTPCWVFTHRELAVIPGANVSFVSGDVAPVHEEMARAAKGRNIWLAGGGDLVGQFADQGLLDELLIGIAPVTLGGGAPLLPRRLTASRLELVDVARQGQFARLVYRVRK
ncbi:MAG: dihydrofolate reductase [Actinobacteria bacterium]|nr:dihydrofolate reductase [Actinomycetota bacterium]